MEIKISDNTFKQIFNQVISSNVFQLKLKKSINEYVDSSMKEILKRTYDRGFDDGIGSQNNGKVKA